MQTSTKGLEFYSAAAQIIPVLVLVVGFQIRGFALRGWLRWVALAEFVVVVAAEQNALAVLQTEKTSWADPWLPYLAIFLMLGSIGAALFPWWFGYDPTNAPPPVSGAQTAHKGRQRKRGRRKRDDD